MLYKKKSVPRFRERCEVNFVDENENDDSLSTSSNENGGNLDRTTEDGILNKEIFHPHQVQF